MRIGLVNGISGNARKPAILELACIIRLLRIRIIHLCRHGFRPM